MQRMYKKIYVPQQTLSKITRDNEGIKFGQETVWGKSPICLYSRTPYVKCIKPDISVADNSYLWEGYKLRSNHYND